MGGKRQQSEAVQGDGAREVDAASGILGPELQDGSRANVGLPESGTRLLCGPVGTDQPGDSGDEYVGSMDGRWREGEAGGGGSAQADAADRFPGSERLCSPAGAGKKENGSATARAELMAGRAGDGVAGAAESAQDKCARLRAEVKALFGTDRRWEEEVKWGREEATRRRWEAIWRAREAKEQAARARRLAAQDQGSRARPARAGPCAACARQGGICGFCRERQRLAC